MWCIHLPSMSRWRAALYFDITINVSDFFVMFLRVTAAEGCDGGVVEEITLNTTDYNFSILGGITVSLEAIKHNLIFSYIYCFRLRQFSVLVKGCFGERRLRGKPGDYGRVFLAVVSMIDDYL